MLPKCILIAGLGIKQIDAYKNVYGDLNLLQANQVDCDEGLLEGQNACEGGKCGLWMCEMIATNKPTGRQVCSCMKKLGFIMVQGECSWKIVEEPQCSAEIPPQNESTNTASSHATKSHATEIEPIRQEEPKVLALQTVPKNKPQCPIDFPMEDDWYCDNAEERFEPLKGCLLKPT